MKNPETRASLIIRLGDRSDELAWAEFLEIYEPVLFRLASRWGLQEADVREVVQESLVGVSKSIQSFSSDDRPQSFRRWLATIARNKLADHLTRRSKQEQGSGDSDVHRWLNQQASGDSQLSVWDWSEKQQIFAWAAERVRQQVSPQTWQAFHRTAVRNEPIAIVAKDLAIREGMVYVARSRVMSRLRKVVQSWEQPSGESRPAATGENHEV